MACVQVVSAHYASFVDVIVPVSSPDATKLVKLPKNTFCTINIGLVNKSEIVLRNLAKFRKPTAESRRISRRARRCRSAE